MVRRTVAGAAPARRAGRRGEAGRGGPVRPGGSGGPRPPSPTAPPYGHGAPGDYARPPRPEGLALLEPFSSPPGPKTPVVAVRPPAALVAVVLPLAILAGGC